MERKRNSTITGKIRLKFASLFRFMLFPLCGKYCETICVVDNIIAVWTRSLSTTKIASEPHVSAKCEYGRIQILEELMNTKSINKHTCCSIFRSSQQKDLQRFQNCLNFIFVDYWLNFILWNKVIRTISNLFIYLIFLRKDFARTKSTKTQNKQLSPT